MDQITLATTPSTADYLVKGIASYFDQRKEEAQLKTKAQMLFMQAAAQNKLARPAKPGEKGDVNGWVYDDSLQKKEKVLGKYDSWSDAKIADELSGGPASTWEGKQKALRADMRFQSLNPALQSEVEDFFHSSIFDNGKSFKDKYKNQGGNLSKEAAKFLGVKAVDSPEKQAKDLAFGKVAKTAGITGLGLAGAGATALAASKYGWLKNVATAAGNLNKGSLTGRAIGAAGRVLSMPITEAGVMGAAAPLAIGGAAGYFGGKALGNYLADNDEKFGTLSNNATAFNNLPGWIRPLATGMSNEAWDSAYNGR
jgi:hypothetical protein